MHTFNDSMGRSWSVDEGGIGFAMERVMDATGFDLLRLANFATDQEVGAYVAAPARLVPVLEAMCQPAKHGVPSASFRQAMYNGDTLDAALLCVLRAMTDFLPRRQRETHLEIVAMVERHIATQEQALPELAKQLRMLATPTKSDASTGDSAESSASTPAPSDSASC